jgi:hypothetical protein
VSEFKGSHPPTGDQPDYFIVRDELHEVVDEVQDRIGEETRDFVRSLVDHGEYQVAIETLCDQLYEYEIPISSEVRVRVHRAAAEMGFVSPRLRLLDELVENSS